MSEDQQEDCPEWWKHADRIGEEARRRFQLDYTATHNKYCRRLVYRRDGKHILTVCIYPPPEFFVRRQNRVAVEFSGRHHIDTWHDYNDNDWTRVERILAQIAEGKR